MPPIQVQAAGKVAAERLAGLLGIEEKEGTKMGPTQGGLSSIIMKPVPCMKPVTPMLPVPSGMPSPALTPATYMLPVVGG